MRTYLLPLAALVVMLSAGAGPPDTAEPADRPNILFVFTDDHAAHAIGAYGGKLPHPTPLANVAPTPNIDRLAREGMLFRNAFVTNSICAPSRAVILTGKHSHLNSVPTNREAFDSTQVTFPQLLQEAGYQTAIVGKWHLKTQPMGFDYFDVLLGQGPYYNPPMRTAEGVREHTGYTTDIITEKALDFLQNRRDPDRPVMLMYQHKAPHRNWQPGPDHLALFDDEDLPEPATLFDDYEGRTSAAETQEMTISEHMNRRDLKLDAPDNLTDEQMAEWVAAYDPKNEAFEEAGLEGDELVRWNYQRYIKDYLRAVASVDDNLGRVLDYLDQSGLADNTIVIYSSDQGFYLGDHGWYDKRWMYEESLRMPLIVRWPGVVTPGSENDDLVQNLDFAETFLDVAGAEIPDWMQGRSLEPMLRGSTPDDWRDAIYYHYYEYPAVHMVQRHYGVRTDRYKLIHYYLINEWELFDLAEDPDELQSVYGDPAYADVQAELKQRLDELRAQYAVPDEDPVDLP